MISALLQHLSEPHRGDHLSKDEYNATRLIYDWQSTFLDMNSYYVRWDHAEELIDRVCRDHNVIIPDVVFIPENKPLYGDEGKGTAMSSTFRDRFFLIFQTDHVNNDERVYCSVILHELVHHILAYRHEMVLSPHSPSFGRCLLYLMDRYEGWYVPTLCLGGDWDSEDEVTDRFFLNVAAEEKRAFGLAAEKELERLGHVYSELWQKEHHSLVPWARYSLADDYGAGSYDSDTFDYTSFMSDSDS